MRELRGGRADRELTSGPGKLCQALAIDRSHNGVDLCSAGALRIEAGEPVARVETSPRIGIRGVEKDLIAPWRFYVSDNPFLSR